MVEDWTNYVRVLLGTAEDLVFFMDITS
ncbi:hypothetical protein OOU_Y34scaffold00396g1 [Pyricularia oryzae Y34]|uniref:Uncharacterized protein n=2 Tax=Pyricularia oryzae TaxID=318829 RepID=A0AA97P2D9_PYRO3|nr:hypothetical protein OOU_Y34scaffold00396g1 [Pyricularia oryzae Y34]